MPDRDERHRARIESERRRRQASGPAARHRRAVRRRNAVLGGAGVAALAVAAWALFLREDGKSSAAEVASLGRRGSVAVPGAPDVAITSTPAAFRIVYRVEDPGEQVTFRTDVVSVRRPWESRLDSRAGTPPGTKALSSQVATFGQRTNLNAGQKPSVLVLGPVLPASDLRLDHLLGPALEEKQLERREVRRVAGRLCQVYRSGDYLSAAAVTPPSPGLYADSCVDGAGLLLEEVLVSDGKAIARRVAVEVDDQPDLGDDLFPATGKSTVDPADGGGTMRRLADGTTPPGPFFVADAIPEGFTTRGRFSVVPPQAENFGGDLEREGYRRAQIADVYERGIDVLVLEQGATLRGAPPFEVDPANPTVDLGPLGTGEVRLSALGNQVRVLRPGGRFLQVTGTLPPADLAAVLRSLREVPGGELVFAD